MTDQSTAATEPEQSVGVSERDPRVQLATERTLLAWVRTGLALMAFGFVIARFALILKTLGVTTENWLIIQATIIGIAMDLLGVAATVGPALHYRAYFRRIARAGHSFSASRQVLFIAWAVALVGIALAAYLFLVDFGDLMLPGATLPRPTGG